MKPELIDDLFGKFEKINQPKGSLVAKGKNHMKNNVQKTYPLGNRNDPSLETWKNLYKAVRLFHERRPWENLLNSDLFAVLDPATGENGYCCVMGEGGIEFGLMIYLGDRGLQSFNKTMTGEIGPGEMINELRSIGLIFGPKDFLDACDLSPIKKLLLPFKGQWWPQLRSYNPGYFPWYITEDEARFLTHCLEQSVCVADEAAENSDLVINEGPEGKILMRTLDSSQGASQWKTIFTKLIIPKAPVNPRYASDEFTIEALARKPVEKGWFWEMDCISMPGPIMDTVPPRLPRIFVCVESKLGLALGHEIIVQDQDYLKLSSEKLAAFLREQKNKPSEIHFTKVQLYDCLASFLKSINVESMLVDKLDILSDFEEGMLKHMGKGK